MRSLKFRPPGSDLSTPQRRLLYLVGTYHLLNDAAVVTLAPLLPLLREDIVELESYGSVGLLMGLGLAVTAAGQLVMGRRADRDDPRWLLAGGLGLLGLSLLLLTRAESYLQVLLIVMLLRLGGASYHPVGISWLGRRFRREGLDRAMGFQSACGDVGVLAGVLVAGSAGVLWGWRLPLLLWGGLNLVAAGLGLALSLGLPRLELRDRRGPAGRGPSLKELARRLVPNLMAFALAGASFGICLTYLPLLAVDELELAAWVPALLLALWMSTGVGAALSYHHGLRRISRPRLLVAAFLVNGLASLLIYLSPLAAARWGSLQGQLLLPPALLLGGLGLFVTYPVQFTLISTRTTEADHGTVFGLVFASQVTGSALLVYLTGQAAEVTGSPATPFGVAVLLGILGALVAFKLIRVEEPGAAAEQVPGNLPRV